MKLLDRAVVGLLPLVPRPIVHKFSRRYIAGDSLASAVDCVRDLNARGMMATLDVLGEFISRPDEAEATARAYHEALAAIATNGLDANISVKLTSFGLLLDKELCYRLLHDLVGDARSRANFVRIDMEDSPCTTDTLDIYRRLRESYDNVGTVLQAYMRRSLPDIQSMLPLQPNIRVCKGIYLEPRRVAYKDPHAINRNFALMVETLLAAGCYVGIATHDEKLVWEGMSTVQRLKLPREAYEFQMLLGVDEELRQIILDAGHRLRVYVPFGAQWYAYSVRRLKENPSIAGHVFRNLIRGMAGGGSNGSNGHAGR